jgi:hypothetical protein
MQNLNVATQKTAHRTPWNKGKLLGVRPPLRTKHVWSIRTDLQVKGRRRDLALFNLAIDSKLRGRDVVKPQGRGRCPARAGRRSSNRPPEENRTSSQVRVD